MKADKPGMLKCLTSASVVYDDPSSLHIYSFDQGEVPATLKKILLPDSMPDLAVQPGSAEDTQACIRYALEHNVPAVPRGASTFGMGGAVPHQGGILLDFSMRREIYDFDPQQGTIRVGAGCRWSDVAQFLHPQGFDLCNYPTSWFSTVGGWASTGGCGIGCTRYGSFHDLVRALTVITPAGELRRFNSSDPDLQYYLGTEGQMGVIWDVTFAVRKKPAVQIPFLLLLDSIDAAFECATELLREFKPYHLKFLDADRIHEINHLFQEEHANLQKKIEFAEKPTLLVCFEDSEMAENFRRWAQKKALFIVSDFKANLLWRERMFPLRVKRIAPGLLASELILPISRLPEYVRIAEKLGRQFHVQLATECYFLNDGTALTLPVYTFAGKNGIDEALKSSLAFVLTQAGIKLGGRPYGIGIWNSPFVKQKFGARFAALRTYKRRTDPQHLLNPGKFFDLNFRTGFAGKLMSVPLQSSFIPLWTKINPLLASLLTKSRVTSRPSDLILENEELCSKCGSCIPVCPAYIDTGDERTTARGKLQLGKQLLSGGTMRAEEANTLFLCMHCGACTDVCQSRLDLVPVWDELERRVEAKFGKDLPRVEAFVKSVESKKIMGIPYGKGANSLSITIDRKSE